LAVCLKLKAVGFSLAYALLTWRSHSPAASEAMSSVEKDTGKLLPVTVPENKTFFVESCMELKVV